MKIRSCTFTLVVEFDGNPGLPSRVLDQSGFPWEVVFSRGDPETGEVSVGIKPLRDKDAPTQVSELYPYSERLAVVHERRLYDYMSHIEAMDVAVAQVSTHPAYEVTLHSEIERMHVRDTNVPQGFVMFSAHGFRWGPLPLSPLEEPTKWPFPAVSLGIAKEVTLKPCIAGTFYEVSSGPLSIKLPWIDGVGFAHLLTTMSWEEAVAQMFPHGVRLMTPGTIDETECVG